MDKSGRKYRLTIQSNEDNEAIVIENPITIQFNINRSTMASLNSMRLQIYNLSEKTRKQIFQDRFNPKVYKKIILQAGYNQLSTIFSGNIFQANSSRNGVNIITYIDARDGGFDTVSTISNKTLSGDLSYRDVIKNLIGDFSNIKEGNLSEIEGTARRPVVLDGNTFQLIKKYSDDKAFIDLEKISILNDNDTITGELPLINSDSGLLGTPKRDDSYLTIDTIFEPRIIMGQLLEVNSSVAPEYDGQYKVIGVTHSGIISEAVNGSATSKFNLLVGSQLFGGFNNIA